MCACNENQNASCLPNASEVSQDQNECKEIGCGQNAVTMDFLVGKWRHRSKNGELKRKKRGAYLRPDGGALLSLFLFFESVDAFREWFDDAGI